MVFDIEVFIAFHLVSTFVVGLTMNCGSCGQLADMLWQESVNLWQCDKHNS